MLIPELELAIKRKWGKEYIFCQKCANDFDSLVKLFDQVGGDDLLFLIWFHRGLELGIIRNYKP